MGKEIMFGITGIKEREFHCHKNSTFKKYKDIDNVLISNKISSGQKNYKYFIGYVDRDYKINPIWYNYFKHSGYVKSYDNENK